MKGFSPGQRRVLADFFGNIAVGWVAAGVIAPFLVKPEAIFELYTRFAWSIFMAYVFLRTALDIEEGK